MAVYLNIEAKDAGEGEEEGGEGAGHSMAVPLDNKKNVKNVIKTYTKLIPPPHTAFYN